MATVDCDDVNSDLDMDMLSDEELERYPWIVVVFWTADQITTLSLSVQTFKTIRFMSHITANQLAVSRSSLGYLILST